jgi:hypothetical protein
LVEDMANKPRAQKPQPLEVEIWRKGGSPILSGNETDVPLFHVADRRSYG